MIFIHGLVLLVFYAGLVLRRWLILSNHYCWEAWSRQAAYESVKSREDKKQIKRLIRKYMDEGCFYGTAVWKAVWEVKNKNEDG